MIFANESSGYVQQDVAARLDYGQDWTEFMALVPGDSISTSVWSATPAGLTIDTEAIDSPVTSAYFSGGVAGTIYRIQNTLTTVGGRTDVRFFYMSIVDGSLEQPIPLVTALFDRFDSPREFKVSSLSFLDDSFPIDNLTDDVIWDNLVSAEREAEHQLRVFLQPTKVIPDSAKQDEIDALVAAETRFYQEDDYDFDPAAWDARMWGFLPLRQSPVISLESMKLAYPSPSNPVLTVPPEWIQLDHKYGHLRIVPAGTMMGLGQMSSFLMSTFAAGRLLPGALQLRYMAGLVNAKRDYPDLVNLVKRMAVLRIVKNGLIPQSSSISSDGLSQSSSFDASKWQDDVDADLGKLRDQIKGVRMTVL